MSAIDIGYKRRQFKNRQRRLSRAHAALSDAMALQGILAHPKSSATPEFLATVAVETADALLAALAEGEKK